MSTPKFSSLQARRKIDTIRLLVRRHRRINVDMVRQALAVQRSTAYEYMNYMLAEGLLTSAQTGGYQEGPFSTWRHDGKPIRVFSRIGDGNQARYPVRRDVLVAALFGPGAG